MMKLPDYVLKAINLLETNNYEVYVVGGAVRDYLLGKTPSDYDLSTNATPEEIKQVFANYFTIDTGIKHGTVTVMIDHKLLEITTYREEEGYIDFRRPSKVTFIKNIKSDLARRDFTINAICFNRKFLDLHNGINDLENKIIKAIGKPEERFTEDPLRILRALRFASTLDFEIEKATKNAVLKYFPLLKKVSKERINVELSKLLVEKNVKQILIEYKDLLEKYIFKFRLSNMHINVIDEVSNDLVTKVSLLYLNSDIDDVTKSLKELKFPNKFIKKIVNVLKYYGYKIVNNEVEMLKVLKVVEYVTLGIILDLKNTLEKGKYQAEINLYQNLKAKVLRINDLKINGRDLIKIGFKEGLIIRNTLERLLDDVINGLENERNSLIKKAKEYYEDCMGDDL